MQKTVVELFAGVGGFRCGLNKVELKKGKVIESLYGQINGNLLQSPKKLMNVTLKDLERQM